MASTDDFWELAGQNYDEAYPTQAEVAALRAYVEHRAELSETVKAMMSTREDERSLDWKSERIGTLLKDVVIEFRAEHARLADLIEAILTMPAAEMGWTDDQKQRFPDWEQWPQPFGICSDLNDLRDDLDCTRYTPCGPDEAFNIEDSMNWYATINSFYAYWNLAPETPHSIEWGVHRLRDALDKKVPPQGKANEHSIASQYDVDIQGLAPYLLIDGKEMYRRCGQPNAFPKAYPPDRERTDLNSPDTVVLWNGPPGWSKQRWQFWKQRLREIRDTEVVREDTKHVINQVIAQMDRAENEVSA